MTTAFKSILGHCGLSQVEAAAYFQVSIDSIKHWSSGRRPAPKGVWDEAENLHWMIIKLTDRIVENPDALDVDSEPTVGAIRAAFAKHIPETMPDGSVMKSFAVGRLLQRPSSVIKPC